MRKAAVLAILTLFGLSAIAQEANTWRLGFQLGMHGNESKYAGGSANANARFNHESYGSGALNFIGRYDLNNHWMLESGLGLSSVGFRNTIAHDYSLLNPSFRFSSAESSVGTIEIPLMVSYKFDPNCKNWKWFVSGGLATVFINSSSSGSGKSLTNDGVSVEIFDDVTQSYSGTYLHLRFAAGREKVFKSGRIFNFAFVWNAGFTPMAKNTVNYTIDSKNYQHEFSNKGNYFGFRLAYYLKPMNTPSTRVKAVSSASTN